MSASSEKRSSINQSITKTISVTSGKGGVGKSTLVANLSLHLASQGQRILMLDGDLGMGNLDIMFGVRSSDALLRVLKGEIALEEVLLEVSPNVFLIPGGSGLYELHNSNNIEKKVLVDQVNMLEGRFDYMFIDTAPGIDDNVLYLNSAAQEVLVVLTPDPASLADAYSLIKVLNKRHKEQRFSILCNMVRNENEALRVFKRLSDVCDKFLCVSLNYKGFVPLDLNLRKATKTQQLVMITEPRSQSSFAMKSLSKKLSGFNNMGSAKGGMQFFWQQLVGVA